MNLWTEQQGQRASHQLFVADVGPLATAGRHGCQGIRRVERRRRVGDDVMAGAGKGGIAADGILAGGDAVGEALAGFSLDEALVLMQQVSAGWQEGLGFLRQALMPFIWAEKVLICVC